MREPVTVACAQLEPVVFDRDATIEKLAAAAAEAAGEGPRLAVFPEAFVPVYPSSAWAKALAGWADRRAKEARAARRLLAERAARQSGCKRSKISSPRTSSESKTGSQARSENATTASRSRSPTTLGRRLW